MIYGYVRVSTDKQSLQNQEFEINNFCQMQQIKIDKWIAEMISGTKILKNENWEFCSKN